MHQFVAVYPQDLREDRSSVTLTQSMKTVDPLKMWPPVCAEPLLTSSGRESRRVLLDRFVAIATGNRRSRGQPSRKRRHSGLRCISGKRLNCARSPSDVYFDHRFVGLATRKPSIAISSLVAASGSNPTFRHGTSDDMRAGIEDECSRNSHLQYVNSANRSPCDVIKKMADFQEDGDRKLQIFAYLHVGVTTLSITIGL